MKIKNYLLLIFLTLIPITASAEVFQFSICTYKDGKSIGDVQTWLEDWRKLVKQEGKQYELTIPQPALSRTPATSPNPCQAITRTKSNIPAARLITAVRERRIPDRPFITMLPSRNYQERSPVLLTRSDHKVA